MPLRGITTRCTAQRLCAVTSCFRETTMNARERFSAVMHYLPRDRSPIMDFGFWDETCVVWRNDGLPEEVDTDTFFGMDPQWIVAPVNVHLCPGFEHRVLE